MIPIRDSVPSQSFPWVVWLLIIANIAFFILELSVPVELVHGLFYVYGVVPDLFWRYWEKQGRIDYEPLVVSLFLHGSVLHILSNMWSLLIFGDSIQDRMGPVRFTVFYFFCGSVASLCHLFANPHSQIPAVGASGAIAGILGAYFAMFPFSRVETLVPIFIWPIFVDIPAFFFFGVWFLSQLVIGTMSPVGTTSVGGIAWWAHVGGFATGVVTYRLFLKRRV